VEKKRRNGMVDCGQKIVVREKGEMKGEMKGEKKIEKKKEKKEKKERATFLFSPMGSKIASPTLVNLK